MAFRSTLLLRNLRVAPGVSSFADDPRNPADIATFFWDADLDPSILRADAIATSTGDPSAFDLNALRVPATLLVRGDLGEELRIGHGHQSVRLTIRTGTLRGGPVRLEFRIPDLTDFEPTLASLRRFSALSRLGHWPTKPPLASSEIARRLLLVRTLDALANDVRHRAVAITLFGEPRVRTGWDGPSDHLRSRVRRLIRQAHRLTEGGYRDLFGKSARSPSAVEL